MNTHNIGFNEDLTKYLIIIKYHQIRTLFLLLKKGTNVIPSDPEWRGQTPFGHLGHGE